MEKIENGKHVSIIYDLYAIDQNGNEELKHQSDPADPEQFIYGVTEGLIEPLAKAIDGLEKGAGFDVVAKSDEAFGPHLDQLVMTFGHDMFEVDGKFDNEIVQVGKYVPMLTAEGYRVPGLVTEVTPDTVTMDFNHPLAGKNLRFKGSVLDVRDATEEEIKAATAPHQCGCGSCGDGCGDSCGDSCSDGCGCGSCH